MERPSSGRECAGGVPRLRLEGLLAPWLFGGLVLSLTSPALLAQRARPRDAGNTQQELTVRGRLLVDGAEGLPAAVVTLELVTSFPDGAGATQVILATAGTDSSGAFLIRAPRPAGTPVLALAAAVSTSAAPLVVRLLPTWGCFDVGDVVVAKPAAVRGVVVDHRGAPLPDATVSLAVESPDGYGRGRPVTTMTDGGGRFRFEHSTVRRGARLRIEAPGHASVELADPAGEDVGLVRLELGRDVQGVVLRPDGQTPAPGALVRFLGRTASPLARTDQAGRFTIRGVPWVAGEVAAEAPGIGQAVVRESSPLESTTIVLRQGATLAGLVLGSDGESSLPLAPVVLLRGDSVRIVEADKSGRFVFSQLVPGNYELRALPPLHAPRSLKVRAELGVSREVRLVADRTTSVRGRIVDDLGTPVAGAAGYLSAPAEFGAGSPKPPGRAFTSGAEGGFCVERLAADPVPILSVSHPDYEPRAVGELQAKEPPPELVIELRRGVSIRGEVRDERSQPLRSVALVIEHSRYGPDGQAKGLLERINAPRQWRAVTSDDGRFAFGSIPRGTYVLTAERSGYQQHRIEPLSLRGPPVALVIPMEPAATISGVVMGAEDLPQSGRHVAAIDPETNEPFAATRPSTGDGAFTIDGLRPGRSYGVGLVDEGDWRAVRVRAPARDVALVAAPLSELQGAVIDADSDVPVRRFTVRLTRDNVGVMGLLAHVARSAVTHTKEVDDADGRFAFQGVASGPWELAVAAEGYLPARLSVSQAEGDPAASLVVRLRHGAALNGRVTDADSGAPVLGALVSARKESAELLGPPTSSADARTRSDEEGLFRLEGLSSGSWVVTAEHSQLGSAKLPVDIDLAGPEPITLHLRKGGAVRGVVLAVGRVVQDAMVTLEPQGGTYPDGLATATDDQGQFAFHHLPPGSYSLQARGRGGVSARVSVELRVRQSVDRVELILRPGALVRGVVRGLEGPELGNVAIYASGSERYSATTRTGMDGRFEMSGVPSGSLTLRAFLGGFEDARLTGSAEVSIPPDVDIVDVELSLEGGYRLSGVVTLGATPVPGARIYASARAANGRKATGFADAGGRFFLDGLTSGVYDLSATARVDGRVLRTKRQLDILSDAFVALDLANGSLSGVVQNSATRIPIGGASVRASDAIGERGVAVTNPDGTYVVGGLESGAYRIVVDAPGYATQVGNVSVDGETRADFELEPAPRLAIRVIDGRSGAPLQSVMLELREASIGEVMLRTTALDGDGRGEVALAPGSYSLRAGAHGYAVSPTLPVAVPGSSVTITLTPGAALAIACGEETLTHGDIAQLIDDTGGVYSPWIQSADGRIRLKVGVTEIDHVAPGRYQFVANGTSVGTVLLREGERVSLGLP